jgi:cytochrome c
VLRIAAALLAVAALAGCGGSATEHVSAPEQQTGWGSGVYDVHCARCHDPGRTLGPLTRQQLLARFPNAAALERFVQTRMPYDRRGILDPTDAWAVTAFLLEQRGLLPRLQGELTAANAAKVRLRGGSG